MFRRRFILSTVLCLGCYQSHLNAVEPCTPEQIQEQNFEFCLDGVGAGAYGFDNVRLTTTQFSTSTNKANKDEATVASRRLGKSNIEGLAAGDHASGWGIWSSFNTTNYDGSLAINNPIGRIAYEGDIKSVLLGIDKLAADNLVVGLAVGYEESEAFTLFNGGNNDADGFTIAPYLAFLINDTLSLDTSFGYTELEYSSDRLSLASAGARNFANYDSDRWFASVNLNASGAVGSILLNARAGYLYTEENQDAYFETGGADARQVSARNFELSQIQLGFEVAYDNPISPYLGLNWAHDIDRETGGNGILPGLPGGVEPVFNDRNELQLGFGLRAYGEFITAILEVNTVLDRDNFDSQGVLLTLRADL